MEDRTEFTLQEQIKAMEVFMDTFTTEGWKEFEKYLDDLIKTAVETTHHIEDEKDFYIRKGNIQTLQFIRNFSNMINYSYENLQEEGDASL